MKFFNFKILFYIKSYSINNVDDSGKILKVYGLTQNPNTKEYILVLQYAEGRNFNYWINHNNNFKNFIWLIKLKVLDNIINNLEEIHQKQLIHCNFHTGNILVKGVYWVFSNINIYISDIGLYGDVG